MSTRGQIIINDLNKKIIQLEEQLKSVRTVKIKKCSDCLFNKFVLDQVSCVFLGESISDDSVLETCPLKMNPILFKLDDNV